MVNWIVRKGGSDTNGGTSASLTPERSGSDGVTNASTTFTSATANFTAADVGKGICIAGGLPARITAYTNSTTVSISRSISTGSSRTWAIGGALATINKITSSTDFLNGGTLQAGDIIQVGAGVYSELITLSLSFSGSQVKIRGDVDGTVTGDAGEVQITSYTSGNTSIPYNVGTSSITPASGTNKNFWAFENIFFVLSASASPRLAAFGDSTDITFTNCAFLSLGGTASQNIVTHVFTTASAHNILYDRCRFSAASAGVAVTLPTSATADYDANVVFKNCIIDVLSSIAISVATSGALTFKGGGVNILNCTLRSTGIPVSSLSASVSDTYPVRVENCVLISPGTVLSAGPTAASSRFVENYNILFANSPATVRTNVNAGANSKSDFSYVPLFSFGQELIWGGPVRPFISPYAASSAIAFGNTTTTGVPTTDILGVTRPTSALAAVGAYERVNAWTKETTTVHSPSNIALSIAGPGYHDFYIPVTASTATTVTVYMRYDSTYAGTLPQFSVVNSTALGVSNATSTMTAAANTWQQLTLTFTPTASGVATLRLLSSSTAAAGKAFADTFGYSV